MKTLSLCLLSLLALVPLAQAAPMRIGVVDMDKVYRSYYKTVANEKELETDKSKIREELTKRKQKVDQLVQDAQAKRKAAQGMQPGSSGFKKAEEEYQAKYNELQSLVRESQEFERRRGSMLLDKLKRMREEILTDLHKQVESISQKQGFDIVFNSTGISDTNVEILLFAKSANDFTDQVLGAVNPAGTPKAEEKESEKGTAGKEATAKPKK